MTVKSEITLPRKIGETTRTVLSSASFARVAENIPRIAKQSSDVPGWFDAKSLNHLIMM